MGAKDDDITLFAKTNFRNQEQVFGVKRKDRRQHMYVIGKTGTGKTAMLRNMALQDIQRGEGLAIVDPHGEFVEEVLDHIPASRTNDVVYFNPADTEFPISFNILEVPDGNYKHLVVSGLMGIFTKIWANVWSARMEYILNNCILALIDTPGTTLLGILRLLVDRDYRQKLVNNIQDPVVKSFWLNEYEQWRDQYRNEAIAPIQNKVGQFLNVSLVRNIVGQAKSTINVADIMDTRKILLVNVSKGRIGEDNSALLGAMLITKMQLAAMERVRINEEERKDFYLYVDEFQNFATESFANILSEARKYRLDLILAHQYIGQLIVENNTTVRDAVFGNVGTLLSFRVGAGDAEFLEKEFTPEFLIQDLVNLPNYEIYLRLMINGVTSRPFSARTIPPMSFPDAKNNREKIIRASRERYAKPLAEVEDRISRWSGVMEGPTTIATLHVSPSGLYNARCGVCGKETKVIFPPDGVRPVYCKTCLKKNVKEKPVSHDGSAHPSDSVSGHEPAPEKPKPEAVPKKQPSGASDLADLGIEFGPVAPSPVRPTSQPSFGSKPAARISEVKTETPAPISLEQAMHQEPQTAQPHKKKEVDIAELKKTLEESMKEE